MSDGEAHIERQWREEAAKVEARRLREDNERLTALVDLLSIDAPEASRRMAHLLRNIDGFIFQFAMRGYAPAAPEPASERRDIRQAQARFVRDLAMAHALSDEEPAPEAHGQVRSLRSGETIEYWVRTRVIPDTTAVKAA